jgi:DNA segregation ATPase FtsK/SpoIIIE-like protein
MPPPVCRPVRWRALGESLGDLARNALNIQGSTLLFIALFLFGLTVFTDLSWFKVMDVTGKITLDLFELFQGAINRWWSARTERKQLVAQLREVDDRVHDVVAPTVTDKREQAKVKERLIEREQALSKHMSEREKQVPPVIAPAPVKAPEPSKRVQKEKQVPLFVDSAVEGTLPPISILDPAEETTQLFAGIPGCRRPLAGDQAQGVRRRSHRGFDPSGPGDYPLRNPACRWRQGQPHRQPGQRPRTFAGGDQRARGRGDSGQDHGRYRNSQRRPADRALLRSAVDPEYDNFKSPVTWPWATTSAASR